MKQYFLILSLILIVFLSNLSSSIAQTSKIDSLENVLSKHPKEDTVKVNLLNEIALWVYKQDEQKAKKYALLAGEISDRINFVSGKVESLSVIGKTVAHHKTDSLALTFFFKNSILPKPTTTIRK